jgi:hypothetical protein
VPPEKENALNGIVQGIMVQESESKPAAKKENSGMIPFQSDFMRAGI